MSRRILLADDSVTIQKVIELTFMDEDYEVTAVSNGDDAVARLADAAPDFVIADVHMPGANGYEVCRRAKQSHPDVPVLLLVGTFEPFDEARAREAGADRFLKKPFDSQELLHLVEELLGSRSPAAPEPAPAPAPEPAAAEPAAMPAGFEAPAAGLESPAAGFESPAASFEAPAAGFAEAFEPRLLELEEEPEEPVWSNLEMSAEPLPEPFAPPEERTLDLDDAGGALELESLEESLSPYDGAIEVGAAEPTPAPGLFAGFSAFAATPEERAGAPLGEAPFADSLEEVEERVAAREGEPAREEAAAWSPTAAVAEAPSGAARLSDDDVDRIARRILELAGDKAVRDVAWEVVPDLAEVIIKDRIREIESQAE